MIRIHVLILLIAVPVMVFSLDIRANVNTGFDVQSFNSNSGLYPQNLLQDAGVTNQGFDCYVNADIILKSAIGEIGKGFLDVRYTYYPKTFITNVPQQYFNIVEGYADVTTEDFLIRAGKHFMHWGDGAWFNPVDIVDLRKDPLSFTGYNQGKPGADVTVPIGDFSSISALTVVDSMLTTNITDLPAIFQYFLSIDMFDGFVFVDFQQNYLPQYGGNIDYVLAVRNNISLKLYSQIICKENSYREFAAETNGIPYLENMTNSSYIACAAGGSLTFSFTETPLIDGIIIASEYYYDSENWSGGDYKNYLSYIGMLSNNNNLPGYIAALPEEESFRNSKQYIYSGITIQGLFDKDFSLACQGVLNIDDLSFVVYPWVSYQVNLDTSISLGAQMFYGSAGSEFGSLSQQYALNGSLTVSF